MALSYQWYKGGSPITGATSATYTKTAADGDGGTYYCKVSNAFGSTNSNSAVVTVNAVPQMGLLVSYKCDNGVTESEGVVTEWAPSGGLYSDLPLITNNGTVVIDEDTSVNGKHPVFIDMASMATGTKNIAQPGYDFSSSVLVMQGSGSHWSQYCSLLRIINYHIAPNVWYLQAYNKWSIYKFVSSYVYGEKTDIPSNTGALQLLTVIVTDGIPELYLGSTKVTSGTLESWTFAYIFKMQLGYRSNVSPTESYRNGRLFEINVWDRALSSGDLADLIAYMNHKYDLELE